MREEYRDIKGFEGMYQVSNKGNVKSLERKVWDSRGYYKTVPEKILKLRKNRNGYLLVDLHKEGKLSTYKVHRLVAKAFIPNTENLPEVNHIDEVKINNSVENLEWCDRKYNTNYGTRNDRISKPVIAISKVSGLIMEYPSTMEASRQTGINQGNIVHCLKGKQKSCGGYYWIYAD